MEILTSISKNLASTERISGPTLIDTKNNCVTWINENIKQKQRDISDFRQKKTLILRNLSKSKLYEYALKENNTFLSENGALVIYSGAKTGRSPLDKRIVNTDPEIWWDECSPNIGMSPYTFLVNRETATNYLNMQDKLFVFDGYAGWNDKYKIKIRLICSRAYHALFINNLLIRPTEKELENFGEPDFIIFNAGQCPCNRYTDGMSSSTSINISFDRKEMILLGTQYAGEMKKGVFTIMHYLMPKKNVLSLHSSVNVSKNNESVTIFFGLSGTGKTTLSADPDRLLIGDDEHCWHFDGLFNIEGGCYAKCINLSEKNEPEIHKAIRFGTVLENCVLREDRTIDFNDSSITENTRAAYPIDYIENALIPCYTTHPDNIIFLTCDAFGILPPVSKLDNKQTIYHFISGYTSKMAGTEDGITEPTSTFSACYGEAFIVYHPYKYAKMLADKIKAHNVSVWLVNTGWIGGGYGEGKRIPISYTRKIVNCINNNKITGSYTKMPIFNIDIPNNVSDISTDILFPWEKWESKTRYMDCVTKLAKQFSDNFKKYKLPDIAELGGPLL